MVSVVTSVTQSIQGDYWYFHQIPVDVSTIRMMKPFSRGNDLTTISSRIEKVQPDVLMTEVGDVVQLTV